MWENTQTARQADQQTENSEIFMSEMYPRKIKGDHTMSKVKEINRYIGEAVRMATKALSKSKPVMNKHEYGNEFNLAYLAAMNLLTAREGLRQLTAGEIRDAELRYGKI